MKYFLTVLIFSTSIYSQNKNLVRLYSKDINLTKHFKKDELSYRINKKLNHLATLDLKLVGYYLIYLEKRFIFSIKDKEENGQNTLNHFEKTIAKKRTSWLETVKRNSTLLNQGLKTTKMLSFLDSYDFKSRVKKDIALEKESTPNKVYYYIYKFYKNDESLAFSMDLEYKKLVNDIENIKSINFAYDIENNSINPENISDLMYSNKFFKDSYSQFKSKSNYDLTSVLNKAFELDHYRTHSSYKLEIKYSPTASMIDFLDLSYKASFGTVSKKITYEITNELKMENYVGIKLTYDILNKKYKEQFNKFILSLGYETHLGDISYLTINRHSPDYSLNSHLGTSKVFVDGNVLNMNFSKYIFGVEAPLHYFSEDYFTLIGFSLTYNNFNYNIQEYRSGLEGLINIPKLSFQLNSELDYRLNNELDISLGFSYTVRPKSKINPYFGFKYVL